MFRFIVALIWTIIFLIVSIPIILVLFIIGFFAPEFRANVSQAIICFAFRVLKLIAGTNLLVLGRENIPADEPVLFTPNHRSIFDIILTYPLCKRQTAYIAKKETKRIPVFSIWMAFMNCQFLDRKDLRQGLKVVCKAADLIKCGKNVCIFPEGTRNKGSEELLDFHDGSFKIAEKAGCKVVPIAINNSEAIFEKQFPKIRKATVVIEYLPPVDPASFDRKEKRKIVTTAREEIIDAYRHNLKMI